MYNKPNTNDLKAAREEIARVTSAYHTGKEMYDKLHAEYVKACREGGAKDPKNAISRELEDARKQLARAQQAAERERERADKHATKADALAQELGRTQEAKRAVEKLNTELGRGRQDNTGEAAQRKRADAHAQRGEELAEELARTQRVLGHVDVILDVCQKSCHPDVRGHLRDTQETIREIVRRN
jgi:chromosome segregation ATPase